MRFRPATRARSFAGTRRGGCTLCGRDARLTFHHLIPRKMHRRNRFKKHYSRAQLSQGIDVCRLCHDGIHALYDEATLARSLHTAAQLKRDPQVRKHIAWVRKQKRR